jgi:hypothetical protein
MTRRRLALWAVLVVLFGGCGLVVLAVFPSCF